MVTVKPFQGVRYNPEQVKDLGQVLSPPFDIISPAEQAELQQRHPWNYVRITLPQDVPGDHERENRYTRAGATLRDWLRERVMLREDRPAFYVCEQTFRVPELGGREFTRRGFIGAVLQEPFDAGQVYPHETTLAAPKVDRLKLFNATHANESQTFCLYPDPDGGVRALLDRATAGRPQAAFTGPAGDRSRFWVVTEPGLLEELSRRMADRPLVIADGHHRYETTLLWRQQHHAPGDGSSPFDYMPIYMTAMEDPGLVVLPIHRTLHDLKGFDLDRLLQAATAEFEVSPAKRDEVLAVAAAQKAGADDLPLFGLAGRNAVGQPLYRRLRLRSAEAMARRAPELPEAVRRLDLTVLHTLLLGDRLGLDAGKLERKENLAYFKEAAEALAAAERGVDGTQLAVLCRATPAAEVLAVVQTRHRMPQKSTYFYPKVPSGLVLRVVEE